MLIVCLHYSTDCSALYVVLCRSVAGQYRMGLFAIQDLAANTELTYDYRFDSIDTAAQVCYAS